MATPHDVTGVALNINATALNGFKWENGYRMASIKAAQTQVLREIEKDWNWRQSIESLLKLHPVDRVIAGEQSGDCPCSPPPHHQVPGKHPGEPFSTQWGTGSIIEYIRMRLEVTSVHFRRPPPSEDGNPVLQIGNVNDVFKYISIVFEALRSVYSTGGVYSFIFHRSQISVALNARYNIQQMEIALWSQQSQNFGPCNQVHTTTR